MDNKELNFWNEIVELLVKSGLADEDPQVRYHCDTFLETNNFSGLKKFIERHPETVQEAKSLLLNQELMPIPFKVPTHEEAQALAGPIKIAAINNHGDYICATLEMFTEKILFFGEPGSGKTYAITIILLQLFSIEKEEAHYE